MKNSWRTQYLAKAITMSKKIILDATSQGHGSSQNGSGLASAVVDSEGDGKGRLAAQVTM